MRVLLLSDRSFAQREHAMLRRLEIGLIDEGCRVVRAFPLGTFPEATTGLAAAIPYDDARWRMFAFTPARAIERALDEASPPATADDEPPIDVVHAFGEASWPIARALAVAFDAALCLEVWSRAALGQVQATERRAASLAGLWLAPDGAMAPGVERLARRWPVARSAWGVHAPPEAPTPSDPRLRSALVLAPGNDPPALLALLAAFALAEDRDRAPHIFLDARAVERAPAVRRHAESLGLLPRLSLVSDLESRRSLSLGVDLFITTECRGEHRTILLEAMALAVPVIARADRLVEAVGRPDLASIVDEPSEHGWLRALREAIDDPAHARARGLAAREFVRAHRPAHAQVRATLDAYAHFRRDEPIPLNTGSQC